MPSGELCAHGQAAFGRHAPLTIGSIFILLYTAFNFRYATPHRIIANVLPPSAYLLAVRQRASIWFAPAYVGLLYSQVAMLNVQASYIFCSQSVHESRIKHPGGRKVRERVSASFSDDASRDSSYLSAGYRCRF